MARARGANARLALATETLYGLAPSTGFGLMAFTQCTLGEEQPLIDSEILGRGREPGDPGMDNITNSGDIVVPMCSRQFGKWLQLTLGAPTSAAGKAASGSITFSAQPANNATISVGGETFTFTTSTPTSSQIKIGATLAETLTNAVRVLNASTGADVSAATYRLNAKRNALIITFDTLGTSGNSFALAASTSPASNGTVSASTLAGGAASGGYRHEFKSGASALPSFAAEVAFPDVPAFHMHSGAKVNTLAIQLASSGNLTATLGVIAQAETVNDATAAGSPAAELALSRFSQFAGVVTRNGVPLADLTGGQLNLSNGLDPVQAIQGDGRISGIDEGGFGITGSINVRYNGTELQKQAENGEPCDIEFSWTHPGTGHQVRFILHRVFLPKAKRAVTGPGGVTADYAFQGAADAALSRSLTVHLDNDVAGTNYGAS